MKKMPKAKSASRVTDMFPPPAWTKKTGQPNEQNLRFASCLSHAVASFEAGRVRLAIQYVAAMIDLVAATSPAHDFVIDRFFAYGMQGLSSQTIATIKDEVKRTFSMLYTYGENVAITYERAKTGLGTLALFAESPPLIAEIHSAQGTATFDDVLRCGGTYARQRYCAYFCYFEKVIAPEHLVHFGRIEAALASGVKADGQIKTLASEPVLMLLSYRATPHAKLTRNHILNSAGLMLNYAKLEAYALRVDGDHLVEAYADVLATTDELATTTLIEPILRRKGQGVCFAISPTADAQSAGVDPVALSSALAAHYDFPVSLELVTTPTLARFDGFVSTR